MKPFASACFVTGAHVDLAGRLDGVPIPGVSNPGRFERQPGGMGLNAAATCAALGLATTIAGPIGEDGDGETLRRFLAGRGIADALAPVGGARTGTYVSIMAPDGQMVIGLADLAIYETIDAAWLFAQCGAALEAADLWFVSTNLTGDTLSALAGRAAGKVLAAATVSPAKSVRLAPVLGHLDLLFTNMLEARALTGLGEADGPALVSALAGLGVKAGVISAAGGPVCWWDGQTPAAMMRGAVLPPPVTTIVDVNGAGDALAGTVLAALARGRPMADAVRLGIAAAQLTLSVREPFYDGLDWPLLEARAGGA